MKPKSPYSYILNYLTPDLLHPRQKKLLGKNDHATKGHCYVVTEALYYLTNANKYGFFPQVLRIGDNTHWYLKHKKTGFVIDLTAEQFKKKPDYEKGRYCAFLTKKPSRRAKILLKRIKNAEK